MCGICGIYYRDGTPVKDSTLKEMTRQLAHRGPDSEGFYQEGPLGLGFQRLSIQDLSDAANQPMSNADRSFWLVYNGEFYNHREVREKLISKGYTFRSTGDTQTLLHLLEEEGIDGVHRINGMFAFALWNAKTRELILARDRVGIKPLYYYSDGKVFVFASEIKAILKVPEVRKEMNLRALHRYLSYNIVPGPETIFRNIFKVPPGHFLRVTPSGLRLHQYWDLDVTGNHRPRLKPADYRAQFLELLDRSVERRTLADVPVGCALSGGVDSSTLVARLAALRQNPLLSFTVSLKDHPMEDESSFARQVAELFDTRHHELDLEYDLAETLSQLAWHFDEPFADPAAVGFYFLSRAAREKVKVLLSGDGADEIFAGYIYKYQLNLSRWRIPGYPEPLFRALSQLNRLSSRLCFHRSFKVLSALNWFNHAFRGRAWTTYPLSFTVIPDAMKSRLYSPELNHALLKEEPPAVFREHFRSARNQSDLTQLLYVDFKTTLADQMLTKVDRMSMAVGLEARVPFLDHTLIEFAAALPDDLKLAEGEGKRIIKQAMEPQIPRSLLYRKKHGFTLPVGKWLADGLRDRLEDALSEERIKRRGLFDPQAIRSLLRLHRQGKRNCSAPLFNLYMLELWHQTFLDP